MTDAERHQLHETEEEEILAAWEYMREEESFYNAIAFIRGPEAIEPGDCIAAVCRVTTLEQKRNGSLDRQKAAACKMVRERGGKVKFAYPKAGLGGDSEEWLRYLDRVLERIAWRGIKKVVITDLSRIARSRYYGNDNLHVRPSPEQLARIKRMADNRGQTIICLHPADSDFSQERSSQTRRSGCCGRPKGTRNRKPGWSKEQTKRFQQTALEARDAGKSLRETARIVNEAIREAGCFIREISHETVRKWDVRRNREQEAAEGPDSKVQTLLGQAGKPCCPKTLFKRERK